MRTVDIAWYQTNFTAKIFNVLTWGVPCPGVPPVWTGVPPTWDFGTPCLDWVKKGRDLGAVTGVPTRKDMGPVEVLWDGDGVPPRKDMGPVEVLCDGDGVPHPQV